MSLIGIGDIETALGSDISSDNEARVQWYIDAVSAFIESFVGRNFNLQEDVTIIARADGGGFIEISDLVSVTSVSLLDPWTGIYGGLTSWPNLGYAFDGIDKIYALCPYETYKVVCTYGWDSVPVDIAGIATLLVLAGTGLDLTAINGLKSYRVGDVEEAYGVSTKETGDPTITLSRLMTKTLLGYSRGTTTYRL